MTTHEDVMLFSLPLPVSFLSLPLSSFFSSSGPRFISPHNRIEKKGKREKTKKKLLPEWGIQDSLCAGLLPFSGTLVVQTDLVNSSWVFDFNDVHVVRLFFFF